MVTANYDLELYDGWKFHYGELQVRKNMPISSFHATSKAGGALGELLIDTDDGTWHEVEVPHDWMTELPVSAENDPVNGCKERGEGWYRIDFSLPDENIENAGLVFDGVMGISTVYVNGIIAVRNFSGYNRFSADIGDYLVPNAVNNITLHVDARRWEGWWYEGAGLYRGVRIEFCSHICIDKDNCFVRSEKCGDGYRILADIHIYNEYNEDVSLWVTLKDGDGRAVCSAESSTESQFAFFVQDGMLWSPESPYLYTLECELRKGSELLDHFSSSVGLRTVEWIADKGMYLNGEHYTVKGICCHQDHAGVGAAVTGELMEYRIRKLKAMGVNAYRCAHHAPSEELLNICDRFGMLVMAENRHFSVSADALSQLDAMVRISRNHPSVFLYSLFNEEPWQSELRGKRMAEKLRKRILSLDSTRAVTAAQNGGIIEASNASDALDVIGVNYCLKDYEAAHSRTPDKVIIGTENCPTFATRGVYESDKDKHIFACYGDEWGFFSEGIEETMLKMESTPYAAGCFVWSGFDYRGEPSPYGWPSVLSHWSFNDSCGFPKDTAYLLAAWYCDELMVHLLPHWNHNEGDVVRVCAFTNGESAELFVNGRSLGVKAVVSRRAEWSVPYEAGEISVTVRRGEAFVTDSRSTVGEAEGILLTDETPSCRTHIINVYACDGDGRVVPDFSGKVSFSTEGGRLLGVGNGDPNSHHMDKGDSIEFFHGCAQVIVSGGRLTAECDTLTGAVLELK